MALTQRGLAVAVTFVAMALAACGRLGFHENGDLEITPSSDATLATSDAIVVGDGIDLDAEQCPPGFTERGTSCYSLQSTSRSWLDAELFCESLGAHLVVIDDAAENDFTLTLVDDMWIGASDRVTEDVFLTVTGGALTTTFWGPNEPRSLMTRDCVARWMGGWIVERCEQSYASVCELDGIPADASAY